MAYFLAGPPQLTVVPSSLQSGAVPRMNVTFVPSVAVRGGATVTLRVASTSPVAGLAVFARWPPAQAKVAIVGLPNCSEATATIDFANQTLTITLPSGCYLAAQVQVTITLHEGFFGPNAAAGTTVVLTLTSSADNVTYVAPGYTVGVCH